MSHDFAKKPKAASKPKKTHKNQVPGWVWLFTGIVTGVFISFLYYLADITPQPAPTEKAVSSKVATPDKKTSTTKFDFYTLLPQREVIVPTEQEDSKSSNPAQATIYILQAGSFKQAADADRLRARLILLGLEPNVEEVSANGDVWHRVQVGPFKDRSRLSKARSTLIDQGIDTLLLKRKAEG